MTWMEAAERILDMGSPMVILAALLYLIAKGGRWFGVHFLCPIKTQVVEFLKHLAESVALLQKTLDELMKDVQQFRCRYREDPGPSEGGR